MERVTFVVEASGERISGLLNPEALEMRRQAGVRTRREAGGFLAASGRTDHPLIATGGGLTELDFQLLFDTEVAKLDRGAQARPPGTDDAEPSMDVRELTRPFWDLAENATAEGFSAPPSVRFIWGKAWNIAGVVVSVAERLERFDADGAPQRSWLSLRMRRVEEADPRPAPPLPVTPQFELPSPPPDAAPDQTDSVDVPVDTDGTPLKRLDQICGDEYGQPGLAPLLGAFNGLSDLLTLPEGAVMAVPPLSLLLSASGAA